MGHIAELTQDFAIADLFACSYCRLVLACAQNSAIAGRRAYSRFDGYDGTAALGRHSGKILKSQLTTKLTM